MEIGLTRMSSKGQIVIPQDMRKGFEIGEKIFIIKSKNQIILKSKNDLEENFIEDLEFAKRTEEAYKRIEAGNSVRIDSKDIDKVMSSW